MNELPLGLSGRVFRSPMPFGDYDPDENLFPEFVKYKISCVVLLASDEECIRNTGINLRELYTQVGMKVIHLPIRDYSVPEDSVLRNTIESAVQNLQGGRNLVIHCSAGIGRTGTFAACLAKRVLGMTGEQSIEWIRQLVPGAVETDEQERLVLDYKVKEVA
jgi:protein-tyrosine phosphatase